MGVIYKYENNINHHIYIGQSVNLKKRIREHKCAFSNPNNPDYNFPIHRALRKYGVENFTISILEEVEDNALDEREVYWIAYYDSYKNGYNATPGGQNGGGYNGKEVCLYDLNGNFVRSYKNAKTACEAIKVSYSTIQQVLHQKRPTCKGYQIKYRDDNREIKKFKSRQGGAIPIYQLEKNTNNIIKEWDSAQQAARELNLDASTITKCLKGKLKSHGGYSWKYKEEQK